MKIIKRVLIWIGILLILFFIGASVYVKVYGKGFVQEALNSSLERKVVLGEVSYQFPFGFQARDVEIAQSSEGGEFLKIKKIAGQLSGGALSQKRLALDSVVLIEPELVIEAAKSSQEGLGEQARRHGVVVPSAVPSVSTVQEEKSVIAQKVKDLGNQVEVTFRRLIVKQGHLKYLDGLTKKGFSFNLEDVQLQAGEVVFPLRAGRTEFHISARLVKRGNPLSGSNVHGRGWVDVAKRDMEMKIEIVEADGTNGLTVQMVSKNNDMQVSGEIKVKNLLKGIESQASSDEPAVNDLILSALSSAGVEIDTSFSFETKMDNFQLDQVPFSGSVVIK